MAPLLTKPRRLVVITDTIVAVRQLDRLRGGLQQAGLTADVLTVPAGESSKSWRELGQLIDRLLALKIDRRTLVLALGVGVVVDLPGFAATIALPGPTSVHFPPPL